MKKCVHVININDYFPELFELTIETIKHFATKIDADLNIITTRKWPDWPLLTEKLQVYDYGKGYDWNILIDADILINPNAYDPFIDFDPSIVGCKDEYPANKQLKMDEVFLRDGRNIGLSGCLIATSKETHNLWKFPDMDKKTIFNNIIQDRKVVDEYVISRNLAKYGYGYRELYPINYYNYFYHLGMYEKNEQMMLIRAREWMRTYWLV